MPRHRVILLTLAVPVMLLGVFLATKDVRFRERDCGTALITQDPNKGAIETGDREKDDFQQELYSTECEHRILGQRILALIPLALALALWVGSIRYRPKQRFSGGSVI